MLSEALSEAAMSRPCVCGGSNDNCRFCGGRGEIRDHLADALTIHSSLPESKKVHIARDERPHHIQQVSFTPSGLKQIQALIRRLGNPASSAVRLVLPQPV